MFFPPALTFYVSGVVSICPSELIVADHTIQVGIGIFGEIRNEPRIDHSKMYTCETEEQKSLEVDRKEHALLQMFREAVYPFLFVFLFLLA